jgi:nitronate monooxygenase
MNFASRGASEAKIWRDIWGSGQGIGAVDRVRPAAAYVDLIADQYAAAKARLCGST